MGGAGTASLQDPPHTISASKLTSGTVGVRKATLSAINHNCGIDETDWQASGMDRVRTGGTFFAEIEWS